MRPAPVSEHLSRISLVTTRSAPRPHYCGTFLARRLKGRARAYKAHYERASSRASSARGGRPGPPGPFRRWADGLVARASNGHARCRATTAAASVPRLSFCARP
ncbi:MAG: hypothetical protein KatS3mg038_2087 [Candidatus Kapaibacterium sp.]|nr:MAG: hypothetical protein KatS3mg038_2087 [Candidatus Kapabacteria bacterium]